MRSTVKTDASLFDRSDVNTLDTNKLRLNNLDILQQKLQGQQPCPSVNSGVICSSHDTLSTLSSSSNQYLRILLNQASQRDDPLLSTSASSSILSTTVSSVANGPAESYVIDLEPGRSTLETTTLQTIIPEQRIDISDQQKSRINSFTPSKLFSSSLHPRKSEPACNDIQSPRENSLLRPNVQQGLKISVLENHTSMLDEADKLVTTENLLNKCTDGAFLQDKTRTLPSYTEALSSIIQSQHHHIKREILTPGNAGDALIRTLPSQIFSQDHATLLHRDEHMDVRFVPYSSLGQLNSLNCTEIDIANLYKQSIFSRNVISLPHQSLDSCKKLDLDQLSPKSNLNEQLTSLFDNLVPSSKAGENNRTRDISILPVSKTLPFQNGVQPLNRQFQKADNIIRNTPSPSQFLSNVHSDSGAIVFGSKNSAEVKPGVLHNSDELYLAPKTPPASFSGVPTAYIMAQTGTGKDGINSLLAIPVIDGGQLPNALSGLQPFAFAPHSMAHSIVKDAVDPIFSTLKQQSIEGDVQLPEVLQMGTLAHQNLEPTLREEIKDQYENKHKCNHKVLLEEANTGSIDDKGNASSSSTQEREMKSKPGRPQGRVGRDDSKLTANKEMKLLTENTLFPGVYTSILKLPWSSRTRNKAKAKTVSQMRKEAQAIELAKEKLHGSHKNVLADIDCKNAITISDKHATCENHEKRNNIGIQENYSETQQVQDDLKVKFPRLDEVFRQSYALQQTLQRKSGNSTEKLELSNNNSLLTSLGYLNGLQSQLFQNATFPSLSRLTAVQFQKALEASPLASLNGSSEHPCDSDLILNAKRHSKEVSNTVSIDVSNQEDLNTFCDSPQSLAQDCLEASEEVRGALTLSGKQFAGRNFVCYPLRVLHPIHTDDVDGHPNLQISQLQSLPLSTRTILKILVVQSPHWKRGKVQP
ncbi:hypothetical protein EGW08_022596 [Elysia chlorotica]|uniref:Uncharacterized protein n=1 Tax=Elysia chlorotica TaxID=188477 RepID=A0A3S0ZKQ1_ELYCH|nr:hypothetical protein EGW08_022596 [Elysia chlorotica]